jgi:XTP/dITP diphosphohydrolase
LHSNIMTKIVLASGNRGKIAEISALLAPLSLDIVPQSAFDFAEAEETGLTFVENAIIKARHAATLTGLPALADDSGLEVDALNGAPGIWSSRFAGPDARDQDNVDKLLTALATVPEAQRSARFQCVIVFMSHPGDPTPLICQGTWEGRILFERRGDRGFGYDPVFYVPDQGCAAAELSATTKNRISHRGQALACLLESLPDQPIKPGRP